MADPDFEDQLAQEALAQAAEGADELVAGRTRTDPDGTVYEWDADKAAWFPKIDDDFIAKYQMSYGSDVATTTASTETTTASTTSSSIPAVTDPEYYNYYYSQYSSTGDSGTCTTDTAEYRQWYEYYYGSKSNASKDPQSKQDETSSEKSEIPPPPTDVNSEEYYHWYYKYYGQTDATYSTENWHQEAQGTSEGGKTATDTGTEGGGKNSAEQPTDAKSKGKGKRKPPDPPSWFDVSEDKNTNVYISGLPPDMTDDEFKDLMNKCGMIMFDPITRKPKLKMYKDENGQNKGDGRCCYIKSESVDLALQFLDGSDVRGNKIYVERAKFELKGNFDPSKRRRKLTKQEKKKFQEKQQKLFDWRPDKPFGARNKSDRVVIVKNAFDYKLFENDPTLVNKTRDRLKQECTVFGEVKKVVIYDRHTEGVAAVTFSTPEEADICIQGMNGRLYNKRQVSAETWDGKTKYVIHETEDEHQKRLDEWGRYLEGDTGGNSQKKRTEGGSQNSQKKQEEGGNSQENQTDGGGQTKQTEGGNSAKQNNQDDDKQTEGGNSQNSAEGGNSQNSDKQTEGGNSAKQDSQNSAEDGNSQNSAEGGNSQNDAKQMESSMSENITVVKEQSSKSSESDSGAQPMDTREVESRQEEAGLKQEEVESSVK